MSVYWPVMRVLWLAVIVTAGCAGNPAAPSPLVCQTYTKPVTMPVCRPRGDCVIEPVTPARVETYTVCN